MKKANSIIIAIIIATFAISMFAFQSTTTEASNNAAPSATPKKRLPRPIQSPITTIKAKKTVLSARDLDGNWAGKIKQSRKRSTQKRQHKPIQ